MNMGKDNNINNEELIKNAAKHLNTTPDELHKAIDKGKLQKTLSNLSPQQSEQLNRALSDQEYAKKILSTPQAQALMKKLMNKPR